MLYTVELTSENKHCPRQVEIEAGGPVSALQQVFDAEGLKKLLTEYEGDPNYEGWSYLTISINCNRTGIPEDLQETL